CQKELKEAMQATANNNGMTLILALSYSGRWEITNAAKALAQDIASGKVNPEEICESKFSDYLQTANFPDPELMIRTSGEMRISNFLLWQLAYTEIHITEVLWPDFREDDLFQAILDFQKRERR